MSNELGDTPSEIFRQQLHRLADWIADYRGKIETLRVAITTTRAGRAVRKNSGRCRSGHPSGNGALESSYVSRLLRLDSDCAGNPQRNDFRAVERERDDMAHFPGGDRARNSGDRLAPPVDAFARKFRGRDLRHC